MDHGTDGKKHVPVNYLYVESFVNDLYLYTRRRGFRTDVGPRQGSCCIVRGGETQGVLLG